MTTAEQGRGKRRRKIGWKNKRGRLEALKEGESGIKEELKKT